MSENQFGHCKDCKFWEQHVDFYNTKWRTCEAADFADYVDQVADDAFAVYADAADDTGLVWWVKTGPMFGCVKFEPQVKKT